MRNETVAHNSGIMSLETIGRFHFVTDMFKVIDNFLLKLRYTLSLEVTHSSQWWLKKTLTKANEGAYFISHPKPRDCHHIGQWNTQRLLRVCINDIVTQLHHYNKASHHITFINTKRSHIINGDGDKVNHIIVINP